MILLRWAVGSQNTVNLSNYKDYAEYCDYLWLAKLSVVSFQKHFPDATYVVFYNGNEFEKFCSVFEEISPTQLYPIEYVNQNLLLESITNPYHFYPRGVWYKWIPFRFDTNYYEISIDTDIICINNPKSWKQWIDSE